MNQANIIMRYSIDIIVSYKFINIKQKYAKVLKIFNLYVKSIFYLSYGNFKNQAIQQINFQDGIVYNV